MNIWQLATAAVLVTTTTAQAAAPFLQTLEPEPEIKNTIEAQLKRYYGQTEFLTFAGYKYGLPRKEAPQGDAKGGQERGAQRAQQEADVFKIGRPGSKLLYLLNNYRGLQVVSFAGGVEKAQVVGRVKATGNYPDEMYFDEAGERLIVLERMWYGGNEDDEYTANQSRLVIYDVKNPAEPKISQVVPFEGEIADSRMVGDILYVASSVRPDYYNRHSQQKARGMAHSFRLAKTGVSLVQSQALSLPTSARENMNIIEVKEGEAYKYYLVAVLSESAWGWWDRKSLVEVVDISDAKGKIEPVMVVSAKGSINERTQTSIKNNTLLVVSNYWPQGENARARVAVETFKLPARSDEILSEDEAAYRKLHIERKLKGLSEDERIKKYEELARDRELGVSGRFVKTSDGKLRKILADSVVTVGDTTGLHAQLQDVRFDGDLLHVFWVPQNMIDPFDLFDISEPQKEVRYLKRLQFDGWIERAIPVSYKGRNLVLGLGYVVENVNNERGRRYPQAMLFEITKRRGSYQVSELSRLTLSQGNVWTDFNGADRFIETRFDGEGRGSIMFRVSGYEKGKWVSGGKLIGFDLNEESFKEGSLLVGESGWLKRVFSNPEIEKVHAFSDVSLASFDVKEVGSAGKVERALSVLELARSVVRYFALGDFGVQVISGGWHDEESNGKTKLRVVRANDADAEKHESISQIELRGHYSSHLIDRRDGSLLVATVAYRTGQDEAHVKTKYLVHKLVLNDSTGAFEKKAQADWNGDEAVNRYWYMNGGATVQLVQLENGEVVVAANSKLKRVNDASAADVELVGCSLTGKQSLTLHRFSTGFYASYGEPVESEENEGASFVRNFIVPMKLDGATARCGKPANIPGTPKAVLANNWLVTQDERVLDVVSDQKRGERHYFNVVTSTALDSLELGDGVATLRDDYEPKDGVVYSIKQIDDKRFGFFELAQNSHGPRYGLSELPYGRGWRPRYYSGVPRFTVIGADQGYRFTKETFAMPSGLIRGAQIADVVKDKGRYLALVSNGRKAQVIGWTDKSRRPELVRLAGGAESVTMSGYGYGSGVHFNSKLQSFELPQGYYGVEQLYLAD